MERGRRAGVVYHRSSILAFSLVEVVVALGISVFCIISIFALLTGGSQIMKQSWERSSAVDLIAVSSDSIRSATADANGVMCTPPPFAFLKWKVGGTAFSTNFYFDRMNRMVFTPGEGLFVMHVEFTPPQDRFHPGNVRLSTSWPSSSKWMGQGWTNSFGSVDSWMALVP